MRSVKIKRALIPFLSVLCLSAVLYSYAGINNLSPELKEFWSERLNELKAVEGTLNSVILKRKAWLPAGMFGSGATGM